MSTVNAVASGFGLPPGDESINTRNPFSAGPPKNPASIEISLEETAADISRNFIQFQQNSGSNPIQTMRQESLQAGFRSVELVAQTSSFQNGVLGTASIIYRSASVNINISSTVLEKYAEDVGELEKINPELLQDYLALIKLLDDKTPESFDPFFDKLRNILKGNSEQETLQKQEADIDVNIPVNPESSREEQVQEFFINIELSVTEMTVTVERRVQKSDPLVLDLDDDGIEVSDFENGREFDINADGKTDTTSFVMGGDAFLALDRNGNGQIDDGSELFGDQNGAENGFLELSKFDENHDQQIDSRDSIFEELRLFDGVSSLTLNQGGVSSIGTLMSSTPGLSINGNENLGYSTFSRQDGSTGKISDLLLNFVS